MGLLSNRIGKESLKPGDHIYSWRTAYIYAHHGIYVGDDKVIHFTKGRGQEVPKRSSIPCQTCTSHSSESPGVLSSCLNCFLAGGVLYRFEYGVNRALFLPKEVEHVHVQFLIQMKWLFIVLNTCLTMASAATVCLKATVRILPSIARPAFLWRSEALLD